MPNKSVIIAEDDELLRNLYERKFSLSGYDIRTVENGDEALQLLQEQTPDLLILDINMPEMDGFQVLEKLAPEQRDFPILMLSNFADDPHRDRAETLKVDRFLEKQHTTIKELLSVAEELIGKTAA